MWTIDFLVDKIISSFTILTIMTSLMIIGGNSIRKYIKYYSYQGIMLAVVGLGIAIIAKKPDLFLIAILVLFVNGSFLPGLLYRCLNGIGDVREEESYIKIPVLIIIGVAFVILTYYIAYPMLAGDVPRLSLAICNSISVVLIGSFIIAIKKKAISQIIGFLIMRNGVLLTSILLTSGMPLAIEVGIIIELVLTTFIMSIFTHRIDSFFNNTDVSRLTKLRG